MWFEAVEEIDAIPASADRPTWTAHQGDIAVANSRSGRELIERAVKAYGHARVPLPPEVHALRGR
jgi:hypothetical protein